MTQRERRRRRRSGKARNKILLGIGVFATMIAVGVLGVGIWVLSVAAKAPPIEDLKPVDRSTSSQVFAADGSRLGYIQSDVVRTPVSIERIPKELQQATVAIEDERFYEHSGIDINAIARAAIENLEAGKVVQGGSTITQQLVRNLYISDPERDLQRKIREATLAEELEDAHSKSWILEQYLNTASYGTIEGRTSVGAESASQTYFNKPVQELKLTESALLAGLPAVAVALQPVNQPHRRAGASQPGASEDGRAGLHHRRRRGPRIPGGPRPRARLPLHHDPRALLLRLRAAGPDQPLRGRHRAPGRAQGVHHDSAAPSRRRRSRRSSTTATPRIRRPRWSRSTPRTGTSWRWRRRAPIRRATSTSPPRAIASRGRR